MSKLLITILLLMCFMARSSANIHAAVTGVQLTKAIEYFQSGKYHEALLLFLRLDNAYKLNPRFQGYIGVCYFNEGNTRKPLQSLAGYIPSCSCLHHMKEQFIYIVWLKVIFYSDIIKKPYHYSKVIACCVITTRRAMPCFG